MKTDYELSYKDLKLKCDPKIFNFKTTAELENTGPCVLGQERGIKALQFGLSVDIKGYNLYLEGPTGVGKTMYTKQYVNLVASKKKTPLDWCYIYNFNNPNEPLAISLPAGKGKEFKESMESFVRDIRKDLKNAFNNQDFEKEKSLIKQEYEEKRSKLLEHLNEKTTKEGFQVKASQNGIYMMPIINGQPINEDDFAKLDEKVKSDFEERSQSVQEKIFDAIGQIKQLEKANEKRLEEWESNIALLTINVYINSIKTQYKKYKKITSYMENIKNDILKNLKDFTTEGKVATVQQNPRVEQPEPWKNYRVNLFIDNSSLEGAPVIMDSNYSYQNLFGKLEYENYYGMLKTDFTMLKPGLLHKANGGYIILQAKDLISNPYCYAALKKALTIKELDIDNGVEQRSSMVMISLKPEPIPLDIKVLLVGNGYLYQALLTQDEEFRKLFKIKVEFDEEAERTPENMLKLATFIHNYCKKENLSELDPGAMAKVIEYASKLANDNDKISTRFNDVAQIVGEAATWAKIDKVKIITKEYIDKALQERIERIKKFDEKYVEMIRKETLLISTTGSKIGQINGLTVMTIGDYSFGKPAKITANTYMGKSRNNQH